MATMSYSETTHTVRRLTVPIPGGRGFQEVYEDLVPELPEAEVEDLIHRRAPWSEMVDLIDARARTGSSSTLATTPIR